MIITSIEKQVGMLPISDELAQHLRQSRQAAAAGAGGDTAGLTDLRGLDKVHTLDPERVAALLADPLEPASGS